MTLISSISGIRGTIGGKPGEGLTPVDIVKYASGFGQWVRERNQNVKIPKIVIGRDGRTTGKMVSDMVSYTLLWMGIDVVDLGQAPTPTVEMHVKEIQANGGIIITASHNPKQWNALKLLNNNGEFLDERDGAEVLRNASAQNWQFAEVNQIGKYDSDELALEKHIEKIIGLPLVKPEKIKQADFTIAVDGINSIGGVAIPLLLNTLGVKNVVEINCEPNGMFAHNPEPLPENLEEICETVRHGKIDLGIVVDPDVDRLAFINEDGAFFGEEYTLVAIADYILSSKKGSTVSNLSSTKALKEITKQHKCEHFASAVGEVNVVKMMKDKNAVIGGEGNGGVIYPELHYGRDALVGVALFLSLLAESGKKISNLRDQYPKYYISKNKIELSASLDVDEILKYIESKYSNLPQATIDGVKIEFDDDWVHLRKSNTEPIIRIYAESDSMAKAEALAKKITEDIKENIRNKR